MLQGSKMFNLEDNYAREIKGVARKIKGFFNANRL